MNYINLPTVPGTYVVKYYHLLYSPISGRNTYPNYHIFFSYFDGKKFDKDNVVEWQELTLKL